MRPFVVLQSFQQPRPTTNPYVIQLADSLRATPDVEVLTWSWRVALIGRYDVFHAHWPEILVNGQSPLKKAVRQVLFALFLLRLRVTRTPFVQTVHNLELPQGITKRETVLLRWAQRWTTLRIAVNAQTPRDGATPWAVILHGHYRDWFAATPRPTQIPGRFAYVGLIRRYKSVDRLVRAFVADDGPDADASLRIAGNPSSADLQNELRAIAADDPRVSFVFAFLDDAELVREVFESELIVLPYREMHNSGAALTTLSLDRPVLVPDNEVNRALAAEVGEGWVFTFTGELDGATLRRTLESVRARSGVDRPDLSRREWADAGPGHLDAYRRAVEVTHAKRRWSPFAQRS